ncbi:MAG: hypothetical protein EOO89_10345 [Pedobacter sp.]|nr:MAG: hypothetical protein EOO89_10345 [Pedobacter sp.]
MKTSNKLLAIVGALFLLVPLSAMIYDSKNYKLESEVTAEEKRDKRFDEPEEGLLSLPFNSLSKVEIVNGKGFNFVITLIKDAKHGIKIRDQFKDNFKFTHQADGTVSITVLKAAEGHSNYVRLNIYSPEVNSVKITDANGLDVNGTADVLLIDANNIKSISINDGATFNKVNVVTTRVGELIVRNAELGSFTTKLNDCNFRSIATSYEELDISAAGKSDIDITNEYSPKRATIKKLNIVTFGKSNLKVNKTNLELVSGSLSDSTDVSMPVVYLKQLLKN